MIYAIEIGMEAQTEFDTAAIWYEGRQNGVGVRFVEEMNRLLDLIAEQPDRFPCVRKDVRRASLHTFPYSIYYRIRPKSVRVIAILHGARNPKIWQDRIHDE